MAIFWSNFWRWLLHVFAVVVVACSRQSVRREGWVVPSASLRTNLQGRQGSSAKAATGGADSDLAGKKNLLGRCWKTSWEKDNLHRHQAVQSFLQPRYIVSLLSYFHKDHSMSQHVTAPDRRDILELRTFRCGKSLVILKRVRMWPGDKITGHDRLTLW